MSAKMPRAPDDDRADDQQDRPDADVALQPGALWGDDVRREGHRRAIILIPVGLGEGLRAHGLDDAEQPLVDGGHARRERGVRVDEHPVVDDLDVERGGFVDQERHQVGCEDVEGVALVLLRAVQREVLVEVALERQDLLFVEVRGQIGAAEQPVVRLRVENHVRQLAIQLESEEPPGARRPVLAGTRRVLVVAEVEEAPIGRAEVLFRASRVADRENRARITRVGVGGGEREAVRGREPVHPQPARPALPAAHDSDDDEGRDPGAENQEQHHRDRARRAAVKTAHDDSPHAAEHRDDDEQPDDRHDDDHDDGARARAGPAGT